MMSFLTGLLLGALLILCLMLEVVEAVRPVFSLIFLGGIIGLFFLVYDAGVLLTPLCIFGMLFNIPLTFFAGVIGGITDGK